MQLGNNVGSFRKQFAGVGMTYNSELDMFVPLNFPSWTLDSNGDWRNSKTWHSDYVHMDVVTIFGMNQVNLGM